MQQLDLESALSSRKAYPVVLDEETDTGVYVINLSPRRHHLMTKQWRAYKPQGENGFNQFVIAWCLATEDNEQLYCSGGEEDSVRPEFVEVVDRIAEEMENDYQHQIFNAIWKQIGVSPGKKKDLEKNLSSGGNGSAQLLPA